MKKRLFIFLAPFVAVGVLGALYLFLSWALSAGPSIRYAVGATAIATMISIWWWAAGELVSSDRGSDTATEAQSAGYVRFELGFAGSTSGWRADGLAITGPVTGVPAPSGNRRGW